MRIGWAGITVFVLTAALMAWVGMQLPRHPGSGAGFAAVMVALYGYYFMSACSAIALMGLALSFPLHLCRLTDVKMQHLLHLLLAARQHRIH